MKNVTGSPFFIVMVIGAILFGAGVAMAIAYRIRRFLLRRARAIGTVVELDPRGEDGSLFPIVQYTPEGGEPVRISGTANDRAEIGQPWTVYYDPRKPNGALLQSRVAGCFAPLIVAALGAAMAGGIYVLS